MSAFRAFARYRPRAAAMDGERCELCATPIGPGHPHVADLGAQALRCSCRPCAILFQRPEAGGERYRTVPDRVRSLPGCTVDDDAWNDLAVPVGLAFFFYRSSLERWVACYPSPAGPTESEVPDDAWARFPARPLLDAAEPDTEALLVRRTRGGGRIDCFLVPIDACYELVAVVRREWVGFDGGDEARAAIDAFLERMRARSTPLKRRERADAREVEV